MKNPDGRTWLALLRGVMPATHKVMSMAALREACGARGLEDVRSYIASGNLLFRSGLDEEALHRLLSEIIGGFGLDNAVFLRRAEEIDATIAGLPFPKAAEDRPERVLVSFMALPPNGRAVERLVPEGGRERVALAGRVLFIDYVDGVGRSKLTAARIEKAMGQPGTARNWNTLRKLRALMDEV